MYGVELLKMKLLKKIGLRSSKKLPGLVFPQLGMHLRCALLLHNGFSAWLWASISF